MIWAVWAIAGWVPAQAASPVEEAQLAQLDRVRGQLANEVHLKAFDLVDELVYQWTQDPVFDSTTPVVLAGVSVPVGLGTGMQALLENHLSAVLADNPTTRIQLAHCPQCSAMFVHSGPEGTVISRGIDNPELLVELGGATGQHALFVDVEAQGTSLVLRARVTRLTADLPIVWSHTITTSAGAAALLRDSTSLTSSADARKEYLAALRGRGPISIPLRFGVRTYARPNNRLAVSPPPFLWLQTGVEIAATDARAWTSSLLVGYSFIPTAYQGVMGQARIHRLLTGRARSITRPDLYLFVGGAVISVWGVGTAPFAVEPLTADDIINGINAEGPRTSFGGLHTGLDARFGNRIGVSAFLEYMPAFRRSNNMGNYVRIANVGFQSFGSEVTFWF